MWFKRKPKNRRAGRARVLDVKLRSQQVRATRTRLAALAFGALFGTVFGLYLLWRVGDWALDRLVYENATFAIRQVDIETDGVISRDQLRRWACIKPGANLLALDLAEVKRNLELQPLIDSVSVERILPQTLRIRVSEREPVAQVNVARRDARGGLEWAVLQLDDEGHVLPPLDPHQRAELLTQPTDPLPIVTGINPAEMVPGHRLASPQVQAALELIAEFERSPMAGVVDLRRVDVSAPEVLAATTDQGSEIVFGLQGLEQQLLRWHQIYEAGLRQNLAIASVVLAVSNNIPARWLDASALPASTPKAPKPSRPKKKNV